MRTLTKSGAADFIIYPSMVQHSSMARSGSIFLATVCLMAMSGIISAELYTCPLVPPASLAPSDPIFQSRPYIDGSKTFIGGEIVDFDIKIGSVGARLAGGTNGHV